MINSKEKLYLFWKSECNCTSKYLIINMLLNINRPQIRFLLLLRQCEFLSHTKPLFFSISYFFCKSLKRMLGLRLGYTIPENVFDIGLQLPHYGTIIVNANARVGKNCRLHACTNIGASGGRAEAPQIGDNVYIAPGVKIYGNITIANDTTFAANAALGVSILEEGCLVGGVPAKIVKRYDNRRILKLDK